MCTHDSSSEDRERLGFTEAVIDRIEPVVTLFGLARVQTSYYAVKYASQSVQMEIRYDPISYEVDVVFWRKDDPSVRCKLRDVIQASAGPGEQDFFQASTPERLDMVLALIADSLQKNAGEVLAGKPAAYQSIAMKAADRDATYTKSVVQKPVRDAAEDAWQRCEYSKVRDLYESLGADLTTVEAKRLEYARSHTG